jgi:hypothetical protein
MSVEDFKDVWTDGIGFVVTRKGGQPKKWAEKEIEPLRCKANLAGLVR